MATLGMYADTWPTTAQASFLGSIPPLATESVILFVTSITPNIKPSTEGEVNPEEGRSGPGVKPEAQVCFFLSGNFQSSAPSHSDGEPTQPQDSGYSSPQPVLCSFHIRTARYCREVRSCLSVYTSGVWWQASQLRLPASFPSCVPSWSSIVDPNMAPFPIPSFPPIPIPSV